jgi:hypothetical protein
VTAAGEQAHPAAFQAAYEAVAIVLDLVQPARTGWRHAGGSRDAGFNKAGWQGSSVTQHGHAVIATKVDRAAIFALGAADGER